MVEYALAPTPRLGGHYASFPGIRLSERHDLTLVSLAVPKGGRDAATAAIRAAWDMDPPGPRLSTLSGDGTLRLLQTAPDQMLAIFAHPDHDAAEAVQTALNGTVYTTDQTDVWVALALEGPAARRALERICPIDLHPDAFPVGAFARTVMEHLGAIVLRERDDDFLLFSASSSAESFLHAVETSIHNTA